MTLWIILAVLTAAGLLGILWPLARPRNAEGEAGSDLEVFKDQLRELDAELERGQLGAREAEGSRIEISRRLLAVEARARADRGVATATGNMRKSAAVLALIGVPALALGLYVILGSPSLPGKPYASRLSASVENRSVGELIARIEAHLRENRDDARGWAVVAPVYIRMRRYSDAAEAYQRILEIKGPDAKTLTAYGEALVMVEQGMVGADAYKALRKAERLDPELPKVQFYLGLAELQDGKPNAAAKRWRALLARMPANAPGRSALAEQLKIAETRIAEAGGIAAKGPALSDQQIAAGQAMTDEARGKMIEAMVARLAERLDKDGGPVGDWLRLARAQKVLGRDGAARKVLARAEKTFGSDEAALALIRDLRKTLGMNADRPAPKP